MIRRLWQWVAGAPVACRYCDGLLASEMERTRGCHSGCWRAVCRELATAMATSQGRAA